jgi:hypothetical protein
MDNDDISNELKLLNDRDLYYVLRDTLEHRKPEWAEACDEYGNPSYAAVLATIRKILSA